MRTRLAVALLLAAVVLPYRSEARLPTPPQQEKVPGNLSIADWTAIRAEYDRHRRGFFPVDGEYHARSYSQQWLAKFDGRGFEVTPNEGAWTWGLELASYGFAGSERAVEGHAAMSHDVDHASYRWNSEIEEWFVNESQGLEHGFTIAQPPSNPSGPLALHLNVRGGLTAHADGRSATFVDRDGTARITYSGLQATDARGRTLEVRMLAEPNGLRIEVEEASAVYPLRIDPVSQQAYLKASNTDESDAFGNSVAISGVTVVVGAYNEASNATGVNGNQSDNSASASGAAYVFVRNGAAWSQQAYLKASNTETDDHFGISVAISGNTVVIGAAQILWNTGGGIIVGTWGESSNATGVNGNQSDNSAYASGAAYIFVRNGAAWSQQAYLKASNTDGGDFEDGNVFGYSVAISGDTVVVGAPGENSNATGVNGNQSDHSVRAAGAAYVFVRNGTAWSQQAYLKASNTEPDDAFGHSVAISGDTAIVGAFEAAHVFVRNGAAWSQQAYLSNDNADRSFGYSVAISGDTAVVGAWLDGAAYVFVRNGAAWSQQAYLKASDDTYTYLQHGYFGRSVAIFGDTVVVGAQAPFHFQATPGAVYVFVRTGAAWSQQGYLKAPHNEHPPSCDECPPPSLEGDVFGRSVAVSGDTAVVGDFSVRDPAPAAYVFTTGNTLEFVTSVSPSAPLRSASGWVGMHIAVGDAPLKIKALGRYCVAGNNQVHSVKLVSANTKNDVPNATASVNMAGCAPGQFVYADLPTTVTLTAKAHYYLVSQEINGGDQWLDLGPVITNRGASVVGSVYFTSVLWITSGPAGTSYVPPSMKYEIQETPASSAFLQSYNLDNRIQRNNFTGFAGMQLRIGSAALTVNSVGRGCIPGNSQTHLVKFVNAATGADVPGGSAVVNMAGCGTDFVYQALASPIVLQLNTIYYLVSSETVGGDTWTDQSQLTTSSDAAVLTSIYSLGSGYAINEANAAYVPPNFLYTK